MISIDKWRSVGSLVFACALAVSAFVFREPLFAWFDGDSGRAAANRAQAAAVAEDVDHYTCPMHPSVKQHEPGKCPICGMDLVPVSKAQQAEGVVTIDDARRQLIGVRTGPVVAGPMSRTLHAVGHVSYDESAFTDVTLKVRGFITKLLVNRTGQRVAAGQPLFLLFSPELYAAEQDFLLANQPSGPSPPTDGPSRLEMLGKAARQRLHLLGLSDAQIDAIQKQGTPSESLAFPSPASGFVIEKNVVEGASVEAGMKLYRIAALNKVWVEADVYEADLPRVHVGQQASVMLDYLPGKAYDAKISYLYPYVDPATRTGRVRLELANKDLELRPGMYASVELASDPAPKLQVPVSAVVYTGPRRLVFLDLGQGRFRPQEVRVGEQADGMYEVLSGLTAGDQVATSGVFLIAAEARISTTVDYWDKLPDGGDTSAPPSAPSVETAANSAVPSARVPAPAARTSRTVAVAVTAAPAASIPSAAAPAPVPPPIAAAAAVFTCPMHPEIRSPTPGKCPKCGMPLVPVKNGAAP
ncbi:MAG TPA: efflux RND transporter periplasmic adaptor subunit [Polyangiaceae bacterium]|jgi:Cu(I)/Ag(I) efflux system membrane fusion protein